jgi:hypothetical protein
MSVVSDGRPGTAIANPDGTGHRALEVSRGSLALVCDRWAPDGEGLACAGILDPRRAGIYLVRPDGTGLVRVTDVPADIQDTYMDGPCGFSPDDAGRVLPDEHGRA